MTNTQDFVWALGNAVANKPQKRLQTTRTITPVVDVRRDDLINAIKQASKDYQAQLEAGTGTFSGWEADMFPILTQPTNKGRLESEVTPLMGVLGGVDKMFEAIGERNARNLETAKAKYDALTQEQSIIDALMAREEAAALENAKANATQEITYDYEKFNGAPMGQFGVRQTTTGETTLSTPVTNMRDTLEDIGTRFDSDFANITDMAKGSTAFGRLFTAKTFGSTQEAQARRDFEAWQGSMKNVLVNANRQAGTGAMSDADAERFEERISKASNPAQARNILDQFEARMLGTDVATVRKGYNIYDPELYESEQKREAAQNELIQPTNPHQKEMDELRGLWS